MGLLGTPPAAKGIYKAIQLLSRFYPILGFLSYVSGVVGLCLLAHNDFNGKSYFSENALQPGLAATTIGQDDLLYMQTSVESLQMAAAARNNAIPVNKLQSIMSKAGMDVFHHNFSFRDPFTGLASEVEKGQNVFGIVRAPRIASTEAVVIAAAWREDNLYGVSLALMLGALMKRQAYWAKDIVILIVDKDTFGSEAWLRAYHGQGNSQYFQSDSLSISAGSIQAALCLDVASEHFSTIDLQLEGTNGLMPNLDLVNLVSLITQYSIGSRATFHGRGGDQAEGDNYEAVRERLLTMLLGASKQASMLPTGIHGPFMLYRIEALTIKTSKEDGSHSIARLAGIVESVLRSINNLLERFHQSFFFYLVGGGDRYASIGMYMPAVGLLILPLVLRGLVLWYSCTGAFQSCPDNKQDESEFGREEHQVVFSPLPPYLREAVTLLLVVYLSAVVIFLVPWILTYTAPCCGGDRLYFWSFIQLGLGAFMCVGQAVTIHRLLTSKSQPHNLNQAVFPKLLLCLTIVFWLIVLGVLTLVNMPLAAALALPTVPALLLVPVSPIRKKMIGVPLQIATLMAFVSPPSLLACAVFLHSYLHTGQVPISSTDLMLRSWLVWQQAASFYQLLGVWLYPVMTLCVYPLATLSWSLVYCRSVVWTTRQTHSHAHNE